MIVLTVLLNYIISGRKPKFSSTANIIKYFLPRSINFKKAMTKI